jgi:hypothetical protein
MIVRSWKAAQVDAQPPFRSSDTQAGMGGFHIPRARPRDMGLGPTARFMRSTYAAAESSPRGGAEFGPLGSPSFPRDVPHTSIRREARPLRFGLSIPAGVALYFVLDEPRGASYPRCAPAHVGAQAPARCG